MRQVILEVTRSSIRVLAVEGTLVRPRIQKLVVEPLTGLPAPPIGEAQADEPHRDAIRRVVAGLQVANTRFISVIPREQVITRVLKLPTTKPDELAQMVALSGKAQLPYPPEQAVIDFHVIEQQGGMSTVQLVACRRDLIDRHLALLREGGLEPAWLVPSAWGLLAWYQRLGKTPELIEPVLVIHVDTDRTDFVLLYQGRLVFSRSLSQGLQEWQAGSEGFAPLMEELERSLSSVRKELPGSEPNSVVVTGLGPLDQWKEHVAQRIGKPVTVRPAWGTLQVPLPRATPEISPAVVIGLAMAEESWLLNLLPQEVRQGQTHRRRLRELALTGGLLLSALLLGVGVLSVSIRRQEHVVSHAKHTLKELEAMTKETGRQEHDVNLIDGLLASRRRTATMLAKLFQVTPSDILFESLVFERARGELVVRGSAPATRQVLDYIQQLEQAGVWKRVELRYSARRGTSADARTDFELVLSERAS